ncbi:MAG: phosphoglycerate dehydrogenase [Kineosporiaceae bacterium]|nr:phosphoglycerate dehydrogenase [Kineosporiaceae bacterium]MBK7623792.1 phosphoglycerate dehydrogenase [Kineosporiaceae bacterium]MBK8075648.1 phosphoglycerate dehydrogenase [Kineosporiaceae bacterium]
MSTRPASLRALNLENIHAEGDAALRAADIDVISRPDALGEAELIEALRGVQILGLRSNTTVTAAVLDAAPDLLAIGAYCIGTNQIDVTAAARRGIAVFNAPFSNTRSVVELALAEIIALTRRLTEKDRDMHAGVWRKSASGAHEVRSRRLGIVGYGNIGTQLSVLAENLGMQVMFYDTADKLALGNARRCESLDELLAEADIVTLHVDGRRGNSGLFGEREFAQMRRRSIFLNLSRGFVVDYDALRGHLESGHLAGAAVDVFPTEPKSAGEEFVSPLRGLANVILTPHIGGSTEEAQRDIGAFVGGKLADYVRSGSTALSVNLPTLTLPEAAGEHRIVHVHRNTPGVLAQINSVLAGDGVNIDAQFLSTRGEIGYVITDVGASLEQTTCDVLEKLPETIRLRVLS